MSWLLGLGLLFLLIFAGVPIAVAMGLVGLIGTASILGIEPALFLIGGVYFDSGRNYTLSVVPLFILMGNLIIMSGIATELYASAHAWMRHKRGGLAMATIVAAGGFASVCGSSLATTATLAKISLPEMRKYGYSNRLAGASVAAGGTLGILIPPSVILILYGIMTQEHIGKLFLAGLVPGLLGVFFYLGAVRFSLIISDETLEAQDKLPLRDRIRSLRGVFLTLLLFLFVLGGIYLNVFTATEAAGMGAAGAFIITALRGKLAMNDTLRMLFDTAKTTAVMFLILFGAMAFLNFVNLSGLTTDLRNFVSAIGASPYAVIIAILLIYLVLGCLLESLSMILLTVPIFYPLVTAMGFDGIWFGIVVVVATELSFITPPVGMNIFVLRATAPDVPLSSVYRGILPFVGADIVRLTLIVAIPGLVSLFGLLY
ncbi:TRAP transporter large permease [Hoeflea poritis]|uniref:TRAP transporter large permease protein n=1 Tax=Hoeflea poritis TaxID=2993659 RepID=A0ABT4VV38_9HYPH|nr:TRAP transporter large permease [Hoeflea poritis]MDA4848570.1 TRAP transporter large permease [Hoeflea poritis]